MQPFAPTSSIPSRGFTLIELLVVLSIILLLGSFALHGITKQTASQRMDGLQKTFITFLLSARKAAVMQHVDVIVCPIRTQRRTMSDTSVCGKRNQWHLGVLAFTDHNRNLKLDANDAVVAQLPGFKNATIRWRAFRNRAYLRFTAQGLTDWQNGHFLICGTSAIPELSRQITLNYAGRLYTAKDRNRDGVYENARGETLQCD